MRFLAVSLLVLAPFFVSAKKMYIDSVVIVSTALPSSLKMFVTTTNNAKSIRSKTFSIKENDSAKLIFNKPFKVSRPLDSYFSFYRPSLIDGKKLAFFLPSFDTSDIDSLPLIVTRKTPKATFVFYIHW